MNVTLIEAMTIADALVDKALRLKWDDPQQEAVVVALVAIDYTETAQQIQTFNELRREHSVKV